MLFRSDVLTMDFCHPFEQGEAGFDGETNDLLLVDVATDFKHVYGVPSQSADNVVASIMHFVGRDPKRIKLLDSDRAPEFI